jgi:uncharacterized OB-fold protein
MSYKKALPLTKGVGETYWNGLKEKKLVIQQCEGCYEWIFYPRVVCTNCGSESLSFKEHSGDGEIYSFTVVHKTRMKGFKEEVPYVVALINLKDTNVRMMSNIVKSTENDIKIGGHVKVVFEEVTDDVTLPYFEMTK